MVPEGALSQLLTAVEQHLRQAGAGGGVALSAGFPAGVLLASFCLCLPVLADILIRDSEVSPCSSIKFASRP